MWPLEKTSPILQCKGMSSSQGTDIQTHGHRDSMTESAQWADSVKSYKFKYCKRFYEYLMWQSLLSSHSVLLLNQGIIFAQDVQDKSPHGKKVIYVNSQDPCDQPCEREVLLPEIT